MAAYIEQLGAEMTKPSIKQHLAAIRQLFDYLVTGGILPSNPASSVRGPKYVVKRGKTPVLSAEEARQLLDSIESDTLIGLRDRALIGVMVYSFARVSAAVTMRVEDYFQQGKRAWLRLHEKGGKRHEVPCHHKLEECLDVWVQAAGIGGDKKGPLFRTIRKGDKLTEKSDGPCGRAAYDQAAGGGRRPPPLHLLPHLPRDRHHDLHAERRDAGTRPADRRARVATHDQTVRPYAGRDFARRGRADQNLK